MIGGVEPSATAIKISSLAQILVAVEYQSTDCIVKEKAPSAWVQGLRNVWGKVRSYLEFAQHIAFGLTDSCRGKGKAPGADTGAKGGKGWRLRCSGGVRGDLRGVGRL